MKNALTFDLEDYMHVSAFSDHMPAAKWNDCVSRLEHNTDRLLEMLDGSGCSSTFFVLGWVAQKYPKVIQRIASLGHEIACHSMWHRTVSDMTPAVFRSDSQEAKTLLEDLCGKPVKGYRAPSFSITKKSWWALEILREIGFTYDSSIFPVKHPNYGVVEVSRFPHIVQTPAGNLVEFPLPTLQVGKKRAPFGGGAYFRILPYAYTRWGINHINDRETRPVCVYLHPWEIDGDQPRMKGRLTSRLRHYMGLRGTESKLRNLLRDFQFVPLDVLVEEWGIRENPTFSTSGVPSPPGD
jgi:polysaccharide deacetylase family protein (PEP-CTERM system associated)